MAKKAPWGGFRKGSGRKSLFPGKADPRIGRIVVITLTHTAINAAKKKAAELTAHKPPIAAAKHVKNVTLSDAIEYCIRRATNLPLED
jgi:hypothetical protein